VAAIAPATAPKHASRLSRPAVPFILVCVAYAGILVGSDASRYAWGRLGELSFALPMLAAASALAFSIRFLRWRQLLASSGYPTPVGQGFLAYLAGFAFTASPGKAGELVRIRYFSHMGVPHAQVVAAFIVERILDLLVLLIFASIIAGRAAGLGIACAFVAIIVTAVAVAATSRTCQMLPPYLLRRWGLKTAARWARTLAKGLALSSQFLTIERLGPAFALGVLGWTVQCLGFAAVLVFLGLQIPWLTLFAIPPASMLIGAASMMPGGIGSTEAATVVLLTLFGAPLDAAVLAAITLRLGSIWFAMIVGFGAIIILEQSRTAHP